MKSTKDKTHKALSSFVLPIVLFLLAGWMSPQTANAQWTVHINSDTSPTTIAQVTSLSTLVGNATTQTTAQTTMVAQDQAGWLKQALEYVKTAERWMQTVRHYSDMVISNARRFTSLKGIMSFAEKNLGLSDDTLKALADIGDMIRGVFTLKNQFLSLVRTRLAMIQSLETRARNGIFDPQADLQDLEDYLQNSIGRNAQVTVATRAKLAEKDAELERWTYELEKLRALRTAKQKELDEINNKLGRESQLSRNTRQTGANEDGSATVIYGEGERVSLSSDAVATLTIRAGQLESQIQEMVKQEQELLDKIQARYKEYHARYDATYYTAVQWRSTMEGWNKFSQVKQQEMKKMIDHYGEGTPSQPAR
jgi:DNA repair exonuclease SbcCD ATPase subunit